LRQLISVLNTGDYIFILPQDPGKRQIQKLKIMKTLLLIPFFVLSFFCSAQLQTDSTVKRKIYHIWIKPIEPGRINHGYLYEVKDSALTIARSYSLRERREGRFDLTAIDYHDLDVVELRKKSNKGIGILIGGITGIALGGMVGYLVSNPHVTNFKDGVSSAVATVSFSALFIAAGFITGSAIGGEKISIPIEKERDLFELNKSMLNDHSIKFNPDLKGGKIRSFSKLRDMVMDADSNVYNTLALGGQVWMAGDLKVKHYRDGSDIQAVVQDDLGSGLRYKWSAIQDTHKLCPRGWHIPSQAEWTSLCNSLGGKYAAADVLKKDFSTWSGNKINQWWSSTEQDSAHTQTLYLDTRTVGLMFMTTDKNTALPVRCIRD
jgi:hypothetical protein